MNDDFKNLAHRVSKIENEKRSPVLISVQYFVSPILLVLIGFYFNTKLESTKQEFQRIELQVRQIEAAQNMLKELFSGTPERAFIAESLMSYLVDKDLGNRIRQIVQDYYKGQFQNSKDKDDTIANGKLLTAVASVNSEAAKKFVAEFNQESAYIVTGSYADLTNLNNEKYRLSALGYHPEVYLSETGNSTLTLGKMNLAEATIKLNEAIQKKHIADTSYLASGRTFGK